MPHRCWQRSGAVRLFYFSKTMKEQIKITGTGRVLLYLSNRTQVREIGWIEGETFHCERDSTRHVHRAGIGFNYHLMKWGKFRFVEVHLNPFGPVLQTTREHVLRNGRIFHFKKSGYERQIFLPLSEFGLERALRTEQNIAHGSPREQSAQMLLFERADTSQQRAEAIVHWWRE